MTLSLNLEELCTFKGNYRFDQRLNCLVTLATQIRKESYLTFWNANKNYDPWETVKIHNQTCYHLVMADNKVAVGTNDGYVVVFDTKYFTYLK